jgi:hypothetical protein
VIGRYVLMFQRDPTVVLRRVAAHARPGGVIFFHEPDWDGAGLPAPSMQLETLVAGAASDAGPLNLLSDLTGTLAEAMERLGVASAPLGIDPVATRKFLRANWAGYRLARSRRPRREGRWTGRRSRGPRGKDSRRA